MDAGVLSTLAALAGTTVGAISSLGTTWITAQSKTRAERLAAETAKREDLYGRFMDELSRLYANALTTVGVDYERLASAYALNGKIALYASDAVADAANKAIRYVVDLSIAPARNDSEMRALMDQENADVIAAFANACRAELRTLL
ncbi:MAG: hypothetical protein KGM42_15510 [Hyphomicrobiales bacterium]|nr:hypothetical protein [Hyphomicrobiales bacterium]